jgi:hypothetical protein
MYIDTQSLIWLFPIAFMCHDFEELILGEAWLKKNGPGFKVALEKRLPRFISSRMVRVFEKSTVELAVPISLIFAVTVVATVMANVYHQYGFFIWASGLFFLHGFGHVMQAILLRRYIPAVITSVVFVIPYGFFLFQRLLAERIADPAALWLAFPAVIILAVPFILGMHILGDFVYRRVLEPVFG